MPRSTPEPTLVTPEVLRGWRLPEPVGGKNARGSILVIGGSAETLGRRAARRRGGHAGRRGQAAGGDGRLRGRRSRPPPCRRRWSAPCRRPRRGARAPTPPTTCGSWRRAPTPCSSGPGMADTEATQDFGEPPAAAPERPARAGRAGAGRRHGRRRLPAPPRRPRGAHPEPGGAGALAARRRGRDRRGPGRRHGRARAPVPGRRRAGRRDLVGRHPGGPALAGRQRRGRSRCVRVRRRPGRASPAGCSRAVRTRPRPPCGRRTCTAAAASGCPRPSAGWASWPGSSRPRSPGRTPRSFPDPDRPHQPGAMAPPVLR